MKQYFSNWKFQDVFAVYVVTFIFVIIVYIIKQRLLADPNIAGVLEWLKNIALLIIGFHFGSSKSSANKDQALSDAINKTQTPQP